MSSPQEITQLLLAWGSGDESALERLVPLVEAELHRLAQQYLDRERACHTLQATELVNEAFLRLIDWKNARWQNRAHFFGMAATLMRRVLVDHARRRRYLKRGGEAIRVSLAEAEGLAQEPDTDVLALDEALDRLAVMDTRKSRIVELRYFGGLTVEQTADALGISEATVKREWTLARAWLRRELGKNF